MLSIFVEFPSLELANNFILFEEDDPLKLHYAKLLELEKERNKSLKVMEY